MRSYLIALLTFLTASQARADVIFDWLAISGSGNASASIALSDAAYDAGYVNWSVDNAVFGEPLNGPVTSFEFDYFGGEKGSSSSFIGYFEFHFAVVGNALEGSIYANNIYSDIDLSSVGTLWTISRAATDAGGPCGTTSNQCSGDTGRWLLASADGVAEPLALLVFGVGLLGLAGLSSRRRARNNVSVENASRQRLNAS
jgi:hypothetical protein